jgi:cell division protein FtsB
MLAGRPCGFMLPIEPRDILVKVPLTSRRHLGSMVTRRRFRTVLNVLALYTIAALLIGYFAVNAFSGNHGLRAKQDLERQIAQLSKELAALRAERQFWERRVTLLQPESIDADMLDERARALLSYVDPRELTRQLTRP